MTTLLEISHALLTLKQTLDELAESPDDQNTRLNDWLVDAFEAKVKERDRMLDNYAGLIAELEHRSTAGKAEAERLSHRVDVDKALADRLRQRLKDIFGLNGLKTLETDRYRLTVANNGGKRPLIMDGGVLPTQLPKAFQVKDCEDYGCHGTQFLYPLVERGMSRETCEDLIERTLGIRWRKSCCRFCPFQRRQVAIAHYQSDPQSAVFALWCEFNALAMN